MIKTTIIKVNVCDKCGYSWIPKREYSPQCPKCRTSKWNSLQKEDGVGLE